MNKTNSGFLAFLGAAVVVALGAYFLAPNMFKTNPDLASQPVPKSNMVDATAPSPDASSAGQGISTDAANADSGTAAEPAQAADSWITPSFDVLRVEPDGSTVIAGKAEPGATLHVMNGDVAIATTQVGSSGDFAVVLDTPLQPGDYQLTLRIVGPDGTVRQSEEVATVSIPESAGGELLAMVSKPGKASRIIAQPTAPAVEKPAEVAAVTPEAAATSAPAAVTDQTAAATGTEPAAAAPAAPAPVTKTEMAAAPVIEMPALPDASSLLTTSAPGIAGGSEGAASSETAAPSEGTTPTETEAGTEVAVATPETATQAEAAPADANVRVDAVEIEGDRIFVAGSATPGYKVRVAADGVVIGVEQADESGRFIIEATGQLAVGDHIISADLLGKAGEDVLLRATVPFNRPAGEALAAVAPAEPAEAAPDAAETATAAAELAEEASPTAKTAETAAPAAPPAPEALTVPDIASLSKMREGAFEALAKLKEVVSAEDKPDPAAVAAMLEDAVGKLKSAAMADLPEGSSAEAMAIAQSMRIQAEAALAALMPGAADAAADAGDLAAMREALTRAETALAEPADMAVAAADLTQEVPGQSGSAPKTILQAPLASTPGAVIIRRGDTLWQISRRTYGEGVRYTTIYVANRSQIQNPDRIKPGQVFSVPENPLENAEELHQQLLNKSGKL